MTTWETVKVLEVDRSVRHQFDVNKLFSPFSNEDVIKAFDCIFDSGVWVGMIRIWYMSKTLPLVR